MTTCSHLLPMFLPQVVFDRICKHIGHLLFTHKNPIFFKQGGDLLNWQSTTTILVQLLEHLVDMHLWLDLGGCLVVTLVRSVLVSSLKPTFELSLLQFIKVLVVFCPNLLGRHYLFGSLAKFQACSVHLGSADIYSRIQKFRSLIQQGQTCDHWLIIRRRYSRVISMQNFIFLPGRERFHIFLKTSIEH